MNEIIVPTILDRGVRRKWINALRSGKYKKGRGKLCQIANQWDLSYCCLGVACQIGLAKPIPSQNSIKDGFIPYDIQLFLTSKNDGTDVKRPWSFNQIANWIEKNL